MSKTILTGVLLAWCAASAVGCNPPDSLDGEWGVSSWTVGRAIGASFPNPEDGGAPEPGCGDIARARYAPTSLSIRGGGATVIVNGRDCPATVSGATVTARCDCGLSFSLCTSVLTMRVEGGTLRGEQRLDFNQPSAPAYCAVTATFEASLR